MIDTLRLTAEEAAGLVERGEALRRRAARRLRGRDRRARRRAPRVPAHDRGERAERRPDRVQGPRLHARHRDDGGLADPRGLHPALRRDRGDPRATRRGCRCSARRTWTSSRWARRPRTRATGRRTIRGTRSACRAARRAARPPRSRPGWRRGRSAPTRAARSSSRPRSAASSGCGRRTGRCRATASSRSRRASTRSARSRRRCATARCSTGRSPGGDPCDTTTVDLPEPVAIPEGDDLKGLRVGVPTQLNEAEGIEPGVSESVRAAIDAARAAGRRDRHVRAAALGRAGAALLLPDRPVGGVDEPGALRRRPLRASASRARTCARCTSARATTASATSRSGGSCSARTRSRPATTTRSTARRRRCGR